VAVCFLPERLPASLPNAYESIKAFSETDFTEDLKKIDVPTLVRFSPVVFDDIHFERRPYDKWAAYGQSKTANVLFAVALDRRLGAAGVHANALHPGTIRTDLSRHLTADDIRDIQSRMPGGKGFQFKSIEAGAATSVWAATAPELEGKGGLYLEDCHLSRPRLGNDDEEGYEAHAVDPGSRRATLWHVSEEMVFERFDYRP
jgi:NAD(P)-dependent dehydrogenase (short-subunit alcohol dehydrogenase family)